MSFVSFIWDFGREWKGKLVSNLSSLNKFLAEFSHTLFQIQNLLHLLHWLHSVFNSLQAFKIHWLKILISLWLECISPLSLPSPLIDMLFFPDGLLNCFFLLEAFPIPTKLELNGFPEPNNIYLWLYFTLYCILSALCLIFTYQSPEHAASSLKHRNNLNSHNFPVVLNKDLQMCHIVKEKIILTC